VTPDRAALERDLAAPPFLEGVARGRWTGLQLIWPHAFFAVAARGGKTFTLRLDLQGYPQLPPTGGLWDSARSAPPAAAEWPRGDDAFMSVFRRDWHEGRALYFPLDRVSRQGHHDWPACHPHMVWNPSKGLVQHLEVVHRYLNSRGYHGVG
jgi:hypothetical protein